MARPRHDCVDIVQKASSFLHCFIHGGVQLYSTATRTAPGLRGPIVRSLIAFQRIVSDGSLFASELRRRLAWRLMRLFTICLLWAAWGRVNSLYNHLRLTPQSIHACLAVTVGDLKGGWDKDMA